MYLLSFSSDAIHLKLPADFQDAHNQQTKYFFSGWQSSIPYESGEPDLAKCLVPNGCWSELLFSYKILHKYAL